MDQDIVICSEVNQREKYGVSLTVESINPIQINYTSRLTNFKPKYLTAHQKVRESDELRLLH